MFVHKLPPCIVADLSHSASVSLQSDEIFDDAICRTFSYVEREAEKVPHQIPILVLGNHRDMGHHRTVTAERANSMAESLQKERLVGNCKPDDCFHNPEQQQQTNKQITKNNSNQKSDSALGRD